MARILLTGATGTLGSSLLNRLSASGHDVICLVRAANLELAHGRLSDLCNRPDLKVVRGDLHLARCGVSNETIRTLEGIDTVVHCAASIDFLDAEAAIGTNIHGLKHVLDLARTLGVASFHHVSTAYVAGNATTFFEDDLDVAQDFRNPYEASKHAGEKLVRAWAETTGIATTIHRPSILVGAADGTIRSFDAFYTYLKPLALTADSMRRRAGAVPEGVHVTTSGEVILPVAVHLNRSATLNIVPVDWAADRIADLICAEKSGTFHIVHPEPPRVGWLLETSLRAMRVTGVHIVESATEKQEIAAALPPVLARLQRNIDRVLTAYLPYTLGEAEFSDSRLRAALPGIYVPPAPMDEEYIGRLLRYAASRNWEGTSPLKSDAICAA